VPERHSRTAWVVLALGLAGIGFGFGRWVDGRSPRVDLGLEDGKAAFACMKADGDLVVDWGDVRATSAQRSFALVFENERPQLLVYPREASWPAIAVPKGWRVAWIDRDGVILDIADCGGASLNSKRKESGRTLALFSAPGGSAIAQVLVAGHRLAWSSTLGGGAR
jgi:hypothetical protein